MKPEEEEEKIQMKPSIQREANSTMHASSDFANSLQNQNGLGRPLPGSVNKEMGSKIGSNFSNVKIHTDNPAVQMNQEIGAKAFTNGTDIYFNKSQYDPGSSEGKHLLAHELTHVIQQKGDNSTNIQRQSTTEVSVSTTGTPVCSLDQHREIEPAVRQSLRWLSTTIRKLDSYISNHSSEPSVGSGLTRHFSSSTSTTAGRVRRILNRVSSEMTTRTDLTTECHTSSDRSCNDAGAFVSGNLLVFCPAFFGSTRQWQSSAVIHEMTHSLSGITHITDRAYLSNRAYSFLTTIEALTNAASYEYFCRDVATGATSQSTAPSDQTNDCIERQSIPIRRSIARFERWNRNAQVMSNDQRPAMLSHWQDLRNQYLGGTSARAILRAKKAYDKVFNRMRSGLTFECERSCDSGVSGYYRYFLFITSNTLHLCPMLFSINEDPRTIEIYKLVLVRYGGISETYANQLSQLAQSLTDRYWSAPTSLTGFD